MSTEVNPTKFGFQTGPAYPLGETAQEAYKTLQEKGMESYAFNFFLGLDNRSTKELSEYSNRIQHFAENSQISTSLVEKLSNTIRPMQTKSTHANEEIDLGGEPKFAELRKDLLRIIKEVEEDHELPFEERRYNTIVPDELKRCLEGATPVSAHFKLNKQATIEAIDLCNRVFEGSRSSQENERLEMNAKANKNKSLLELILQLIKSLDSAKSKIIQNSSR